MFFVLKVCYALGPFEMLFIPRGILCICGLIVTALGVSLFVCLVSVKVIEFSLLSPGLPAPAVLHFKEHSLGLFRVRPFSFLVLSSVVLGAPVTIITMMFLLVISTLRVAAEAPVQFGTPLVAVFMIMSTFTAHAAVELSIDGKVHWLAVHMSHFLAEQAECF